MPNKKITNAGRGVTTASIGVLDYNSPIAIEVDLNGIILPVAHEKGLTVVIPQWPFPAPVGSPNDLYVYLNDEVVFHEQYKSPLTQPEYRPIIKPEYFEADGTYRLRYETVTDGNIAYSEDRVLTVKRVPSVKLVEPVFPSATLRGYLNCSSKPPLWEAVIVRISVPTAIKWIENDKLYLSWSGYANLNASGPAWFCHEFVRTLTRQDVPANYDFLINDYDYSIKPLERDSSALVMYWLVRDDATIAVSRSSFVKLDRKIPGGTESCGP